MKLNLRENFSTLIKSKKKDLNESYLIESITKDKNIFVGLSPENFPSILLSLDRSSDQNQGSIDLNGIKTEFNVEAEFSLDQKKFETKSFDIVSCTEEDINSQNFFFDFFERFLNREKKITSKQLKEEIKFIRKLFSYKKKPALNTIMGLWSEMFVIYISENPNLWIEGWHTKPRSTFDFKFFNLGIDVKSFGGHKREHHFQLEQLKNISVEQTLIISMNLQESSENKGLSVHDLFNKIIKNVEDSKLVRKLENLLFKIGGDNNSEVMKFNKKIALDSLKIIKGEDIPCISENIPEGITEIKFKASCENTPQFKFSSINQKKISNGKRI